MMPSFENLLVVVAIGFLAPFALGLAPSLRLPSVVLEILAGIVIGPAVLGLAEVDATVEVVALIGLAFVLFLAGLEIDLGRLGARVLRPAAIGYAASVALAVALAAALGAAGLVETPLLVAVTLCATSLGVLVPVLKDAGQIETTFGQLVIAAATVADFGAIILLSLLFSGEGGTGATLLLLGGVVAAAIALYGVVRGAERSRRIRANLLRLQDTTAQIRVRAALVLFVGFAALAEALGLEVILGAFVAGALISIADRDQVMTHPDFRRKLEAIGFGFFVPVFFVASGVRFDLDALAASTSSLLMVPIFLAALVVVRGLPALAYRRLLDGRHTAIAGLLQATSLPFIVAATGIGMELGLIGADEGAALVGAGLLSVLLFPLAALVLLRRAPAPAPAPAPARVVAL